MAIVPLPMPRPFDSVTWPTDRPFTTAEAADRGLTPRMLTGLCRANRLWRPVKGVYVDRSLPDDLDVRISVLRLVVPRDAFIADRTAAWLFGAAMALAPNDHLRVPALSVYRVPDHGRLRNPLVTSGERDVLASDLCEVGGLVVTTPLRTALDLGRLQKRDLAMAGLDAMMRLGRFTRAELLESVERFAKQRGVRQLRVLAPLADPGSESAGESALKLRWSDAGAPPASHQVPVARPGGRYYYIDLGLETHRFGVEYDGEEFHSTDAQRAHDSRRRRWLREEARWTIEVFTRSRVFGQRQDATETIAARWRELQAAAPVSVYLGRLDQP